MAIRLICVCGKTMSLPEKYAGEHVQCPDCQAMLHVPSPEEDERLARWNCACGMRLKARARSAGRRVKCPRCAAMVTVPGRKPPSSVPPVLPPPAAPTAPPAAATPPPSAPRGEIDISQQLPRATPPGQSPSRDYEVSREFPAVGPVPDESDLDAALRPSTAPPVSGEDAGAEGGILEPEDGPIEDIPLTPDESGIEMAPRLSDLKDLEMAEPPEYGIEAPPRPAERPAPPLPKPSGLPVARAAAEPSRAPRTAEPEDDEGIRAAFLTKYFNVQSGIEAAKAGVWQVINGYWLYIPCALFFGCVFFLAMMLIKWTGGSVAGGTLVLALPALGAVFLLGALLGCVADGIFERAMGIERFLAHGLRHFLRVLAVTALLSPLIAAAAVLWGVLGGWMAAEGGFLMLLFFLVIGLLGSVLAGAVVLAPLCAAVLEGGNPLAALLRGLLFIVKHPWWFLSLSLASVVIGCGSIALFRMLWAFVKPWLFSAPPWLYGGLEAFMAGLILSALGGQLAASLMLIYLSQIGDEERLREIESRLKRAPAARPALLYAAMAAGAVALFGLSGQVDRHRAEIESLAERVGERSPAPMAGDEAPTPLETK